MGYGGRTAIAAALAIGAIAGLLGACVGDDPELDRSDAGGVDDADPPEGARTGDSGGGSPDGGPPCAEETLFGDPKPVEGLNSIDDETSATFSSDELTAYFARSAGDQTLTDLWVATRPTTSGPFVGAAKVDINSPTEDDNITTTSDARTVFFHSERSGERDIFRATRPDLVSPLLPAQPIGINTPTAEELDPFILPDGKTLYFISNRTEQFLLYRAASTGTDFANASEVKEINAFALDAGRPFSAQPVLSDDGLTLYFASRATVVDTLDIYVATKSNALAAFGVPKPLVELNGPSTDDAPAWISPDRCRLYFRSDRQGTMGKRDIWVATRKR